MQRYVPNLSVLGEVEEMNPHAVVHDAERRGDEPVLAIPFVSVGKVELGVSKEGGRNGVEDFGQKAWGRQKRQIRNHRDASARLAVLEAFKSFVQHLLRFFSVVIRQT